MLRLRDLLGELVDAIVLLLDRSLRVVDLVFHLIDFRDQRGVGLQQHLRLIGDLHVDVLHLFLARCGLLQLRDLFLQVGDLRV